ncbi:MAG: tetratricopeptide repeat protein [Opitutaceae bacterium]
MQTYHMTDKTTPAKKSAKSDDRNLVASEDSQSGPTIEDRLLTYWQKNRAVVLGLIFAVLLVIVGREIWNYMQASREADTREAYGRAATTEERLAFANAHPGHPLAGAALLAVADDSYTKRDYAEAARRYAEAAQSLTEPALAARARLGQGISALQSDNSADGANVLQMLADDAGAPESLRVEALFHLASAAEAAGDHAKAREHLDKLEAMNPTGIWASRASSLRARLPLAEEASEEAPSISLPKN